MRHHFVLLLILILAATATGQRPTTMDWVENPVVAGEAGERLEDFMRRLEPFGFHGVVLVADRGEVLLHQAYGLADVENGIKTTIDNVFSTGSVTKQYTATAIMALEEEMIISVEDPIDRFFESVPADKQGITIHHLLTHTAGLRSSYGPDEQPIARDEWVQQVLAEPLDFPPGERFQYSNAGYGLLAAVVEIVTGQSFEDYLRWRFWVRTGQRSTGLHGPLWGHHEVARSHNAEMGYPSPADRPADCWNLTGSGGILTTAAQLYRWHRQWLGGHIVNDASFRKMTTPWVKETEDGNSYYGYGWVIQESRTGDTVIWHNGGAMPHGWSCALYWYKEADATFIVFSNAPMDGVLPVDHVVVNLSSLLFGDREVVTPPALSDQVPSSKTAGRYEYDGGSFEITVENGALAVAPSGQGAVDALFPSPFADRMAGYSEKTKLLFANLGAGEFAKANEESHFIAGPDGEAMLRQWWESFDSLGTFNGAEIAGSIFGGGDTHTYARLNFKKGTVDCRVSWAPPGRCMGLGETAPLVRIMRPVGEAEFASYSLMEGVNTLTWSGKTISFTNGVEARK